MYRFSDWAFTYTTERSHGYPWWMDVRHIACIYRLVSLGLFKNVLEVGCHNGASTSAYLQALNDGAEFQLTLCDRCVRPTLRQAVARFRQKATFLETDSLHAITPAYDLIILDADHRIGQVSREIGLFLLHQTATIIAHDTNSKRIPGCEGAVFLGDVLKNHPEYRCLEDRKKRRGEFTDRGLLLATRDQDVFKRAKPVWDEVMALKRKQFQ